MFSNVKPGDVVHYLTPQGQNGKGKVVLRYDTHVVVNRGKGQPAVVNDKNYVKHVRGGKVIGALLSRVGKNEDAHDAEAASSRVAKTKHKKKKLVSEVNKSTLINYLHKSMDSRKKHAIRARNAHTVHDPDRLGGADGERADYEFKKNRAVVDKRSKGIKTALKKIASNLPSEPLKKHSDSEGARHGGWGMSNEESLNEILKHRPGAISRLRAQGAKQRELDVKEKDRAMKKDPDAFNKHKDRLKTAKQLVAAAEKVHRDLKLAKPGQGKAIDSRTHNHLMRKIAALKEARNEYDANIKMAQSSKPTAKGHYLMRDGRRLSGPHSPEEAVKQYKGMGDSKGVKIVHVKEGVETDVTAMLMEANETKYEKAVKKIVLAKKKQKGNNHVDTEPKLHLPDKGTGGPMEGSHEGERNDRIP